MASTCHGWYVNSNLNPTPSNIQHYRNYRELPQQQQWTPGEGTPASEGPTTGEGTSTTSPKAEDVEGEVDEGAITDASLLPTEPQNRESCLTASSTYVIFNPNNREVTLNPAPTGSLNRQILMSEGSGGPLSTAWNMCPYTELKQPLTIIWNPGRQAPDREHK